MTYPGYSLAALLTLRLMCSGASSLAAPSADILNYVKVVGVVCKCNKKLEAAKNTISLLE